MLSLALSDVDSPDQRRESLEIEARAYPKKGLKHKRLSKNGTSRTNCSMSVHGSVVELFEEAKR
jgi:hypothetical protein